MAARFEPFRTMRAPNGRSAGQSIDKARKRTVKAVAPGLYLLALAACRIRPVIVLDGPTGQWDWMRIRKSAVMLKGLKRGLFVAFHRVTRRPDDDGECEERVDPQEIYKGIRLLPVVHYSLCVSLEVASHELDFSDPVHLAELRRWFAYARDIVDELRSVFVKVRPSAVAYMHGYFVEAAIARQLSVEFGFQLFAFENTFNSKRIILEPVSGIAVNKNSASAWFEFFDPQDSESEKVRAEKEIIELNDMKVTDHRAGGTRFEWPPGRKRILLLAQVYTDCSVLFGSRVGASAPAIARELVQFAAEKNHFVLIKLHPKEKNGADPVLSRPYDNLTLRRFYGAGYPWNDAGLQYHALDSDNAWSTLEAIRSSDVVVTINSQGGFEAQVLGKEVVLLGDAFYDYLGITWNVPHLSQLRSILGAVLTDGHRLANPARAAVFFRIFFDSYCIGRTPEDFIAALRARRFKGKIFDRRR